MRTHEGLDERVVAGVEILQRAARDHVAVVTHNIPSARVIGDEFAVLHEGHMIARGSLQDLYASDDPLVKAFMRSHGGG